MTQTLTETEGAMMTTLHRYLIYLMFREGSCKALEMSHARPSWKHQWRGVVRPLV